MLAESCSNGVPSPTGSIAARSSSAFSPTAAFLCVLWTGVVGIAALVFGSLGCLGDSTYAVCEAAPPRRRSRRSSVSCCRFGSDRGGRGRGLAPQLPADRAHGCAPVGAPAGGRGAGVEIVGKTT